MSAELENIIAEKYHQLYSCVYRMTGNHHDAEDVLQNAYLKAYRHLPQFKAKSQLYTWLYRIVLNESYRFFEKVNKLPVLRITESRGISEAEFFAGLQYEPDLADNIYIEEMRERCLQGFLKCMPKNQRVCFLLKTFLNLKNKEIAEVLQISESNVKVTLHRGRQKLKDLFAMRCSLIDPEKPCQCYLWVKFMKDHNLETPPVHYQKRAEELKKEHFRNMSLLHKINYLYTVEPRWPTEKYIRMLKKVAEML